MTKFNPKRSYLLEHRHIFAAVLFVLATTGCRSTMPTPPDSSGHHATSRMFPLRFKVHDFAAHCYNTRECTVIYDNHDFTRLDAQTPSPSLTSPDYRDHWAAASYLGVGNFPPPAEVRWRSMDGDIHDVKVDIGAIFKDERVLHRVPESEIPENSFDGEPGIFLEVNDRVISVYMKAFIATKTEQIPGNRNSHFREDLILAWSQAY